MNTQVMLLLTLAACGLSWVGCYTLARWIYSDSAGYTKRQERRLIAIAVCLAVIFLAQWGIFLCRRKYG